MPVHVAITRRVRPGREAEFRRALHEYLQASFARDGVLGAMMVVPPPGSDSREFGILRSFASKKALHEFYASPLFQAWEMESEPLTEKNSWTLRPLHGLEGWFRSPNPPPRWKMAIATFLGVFPSATILNLTLGPAIQSWNVWLHGAVLSACVVALLTWAVMPPVTRLLDAWLHSDETETGPASLWPKGRFPRPEPAVPHERTFAQADSPSPKPIDPKIP